MYKCSFLIPAGQPWSCSTMSWFILTPPSGTFTLGNPRGERYKKSFWSQYLTVLVTHCTNLQKPLCLTNPPLYIHWPLTLHSPHSSSECGQLRVRVGLCYLSAEMEALIIKLMYGFNRWLSLTLCIVPWGSRMEIVSFPVAQWPKWKIWHCWQESYRHRFVRVCVCVCARIDSQSDRWMDGYLKCDFVACLRNWNCTEMFICKAATNDSWDVCIWMSLLTPARSYSSHDIILVTAVFLFFLF